MREVTSYHLKEKKLSENKVLACMVRLLDLAYFRPGNERYTQKNNTFGLTTIRSKHVDVEGNEIDFHYVGKGGKTQHRVIENQTLADIVKRLDDIPGHEVFKYFDDDGNKVYVSASMLNDYIAKVMGEGFSAKDFRTWAGTYLASILLDKIGPTKDIKLNKKNVLDVIDKVASQLGNTPQIAKSNYIDPRVVKSYANGTTIREYIKEAMERVKTKKYLSPEELAVRALLFKF
jgi:DNA topoisomerase-1